MKLYGTDRDIEDTTGRLILATYRQSGAHGEFASIAIDKGAYPDTIERYNIRKVSTVTGIVKLDFY